ncbi:type II secretion system protein E [mine drainage metagenome]|uniref:Type II secretion system protein E n=1 Tax=mine drainage metagenome TaxID=410659 RepID=A0A1J5S0H1_9ZZZZ
MTAPGAGVKPLAAQRTSVDQLLIAQGVVSEDQLRIARLEQAKSDQPIGRLLVGLGFVSEATLREALSETLGEKSIDLAHAIIDPAALRLVPQQLAQRHHLLPLAYDAEERRLTVAIADSKNLIALDLLRALTPPGLSVETLLAGESEIARAIDQHYGHELSIDGILHEIETGEIDYRSLAAAADQYSQPVVRLVEALLTDAVKRGASDIHFEPEASFLRIRYRIDGILRQIRALHKSYWAAMAVRIKVLCGMNIAETRAPQDGRMSSTIDGRPVDFRAAVQPTLHGENLVLRILDRHRTLLALDQLGLDETQLELLLTMIARPEGIVLVTGPTGSGKTTTLYSILSHINCVARNVMTLEDPVEYPMPMIRQTSVAETAKLDFANGIRSMMRQDPDVILVGEIRDLQTAEMAFRAAMTGHQVYSTLHTNSAIGVVPRLIDIGIAPDIMAGNIIGVIAQRLVRRLCPHCRSPYRAEAKEQRLFGLERAAPLLYRAAGCAACDFQGYRGRLPIMELLRMDGDLDELVARHATSREIRNAALGKGYRALADDGLRRVLDGSTSLAEVARVLDLTEHR